MSDLSHLLTAQLVALCVGALFVVFEYLRFKNTASKPARRAFLEGLRVWGLVAVSEALFYVAIRYPAPDLWILCGLLAPIGGALIFNNLHLFLYSRLGLDKPE